MLHVHPCCVDIFHAVTGVKDSVCCRQLRKKITQRHNFFLKTVHQKALFYGFYRSTDLLHSADLEVIW